MTNVDQNGEFTDEAAKWVGAFWKPFELQPLGSLLGYPLGSELNGPAQAN